MTASDRNLVLEVVTDAAALAGLEHEWDDLHRDSPDAWPHESWSYLYSWWETYGTSHELRVVTMRAPDGGQLVGAMPLMVTRRRGFRTLSYAADEEPVDVLARRGWRDPVAAALPRALRRLGGWDLAELRLVRPDAHLWNVYGRWRGAREHRAVAHCPYVAAGPEEEVFASLSRNRRSTVRRAVRRAAEDGLRCRRATATEAAAAAERLVVLHRELWAGREISAEHAAEEFERFVVAVAARMVPRGLADILEWTRDGRVEMAVLLLYGPAAVHCLHVGASRYALDRLQWSSLYVLEALAIARERGTPQLDLAHGDEPYKASWRPCLVPYHRIRLARGPLGRAFFALAGLRRTVRAVSEWRSRRRAAPRSPAPSPAPGA